MPTPAEIRNQSFESVPKGYDRQAVDAFLERIADTVERLQSESEQAKGKAGIAAQLADHLEQLASRLRGGEVDSELPEHDVVAPERNGEEVARGDSTPPGDATPNGEAARLVALDMALAGQDRGAVAAHLESEFGIIDSGAMLDEVFARVG